MADAGVAEMLLERPFEALAPTLDAPVLNALARAEAAFTGNELAEMIGASPNGVRKALARLAQQGLVISEAVGRNAVQHRLNREHLLASAILEIAGARRRFIAELRAIVTGWSEQPVAVVLYGSAARREMAVDSDIDLLIVAPAAVEEAAWGRQLDALAAGVRVLTGNAAEIAEVIPEDLEDPGADPWIRQALDDGVLIVGDPSLLRQARRAVRS